MPKFESSRLNGVAVIAKTYKQTHTHTHILPNLGNTSKKNFFAVIEKYVTRFARFRGIIMSIYLLTLLSCDVPGERLS